MNEWCFPGIAFYYGNNDFIHCHIGLGTSSILGGAILAALWRAAGQKHTHNSLIHAVGWQLPLCGKKKGRFLCPFFHTGAPLGTAANDGRRLAGPVWWSVWWGEGLPLLQRPPGQDLHRAAGPVPGAVWQAWEAPTAGLYWSNSLSQESSPGMHMYT